ncbi:MAG: transcription termination factor NusA [Gammaproteobacteria bacterium]|jgi:N utilization substance protein A
MGSKEILQVVELFSNEKGIPKGIVFEAIEQALATATRKRYEDEEADIRVAIDRATGEYDTFRRWVVVPDDHLAILGSELTTEEAAEIDAGLQVGDEYEIEVESADFGRIEAQTAKQVIVQKVREAEREKVVADYESRLMSLINGTVKKVTRDSVIVDLGGVAEALLPRENLIGREIFRVNDRVRAILQEIRTEGRGPQLILSRTSSEFLIELFKIEVPEIAEETIEIRGAARDPGMRAKIAVKTNDGRIDPVGACVGMRGARVQAVSNELNGERVDIVLWDDNPAQLVINAMAPAEVSSIVMDEDNRSMDVAVTGDNLAQAIGRGGQNVRLASELTGWKLNVMSEEQAVERQEAESEKLVNMFMVRLDADAELARILVEEGFTSIDEVAYVPVEEMLSIDGFDEDLVETLRARARDVLLTAALAGDESREPQDDLLTMEGMTPGLAYQLADRGVCTMEDLAELSVDELTEIEGVDEAAAAALIMKAREPWFADDADESAEESSEQE